MRAPVWILCLFVVAAAACGNKIGDECTDSRDCSPEGDRVCDSASPNGYCTQLNCDYDTCPEESVCIRFFPVTHLTKDCAGPEDCTLDEVCTQTGKCAPRSTERRFCMLKCDEHDDCRDAYECRNADRITAHGGEAVPDPRAPESSIQEFCAPARTCTTDDQCSFGDTCVVGTGKNYCEP